MGNRKSTMSTSEKKEKKKIVRKCQKIPIIPPVLVNDRFITNVFNDFLADLFKDFFREQPQSVPNKLSINNKTPPKSNNLSDQMTLSASITHILRPFNPIPSLEV